MKEKKTILFKLGVLVELDADEVAAMENHEFSEVDRIGNRLTDAINRELVIDDSSSHLGWRSMKYTILDEQMMNCGRCDVCGVWVSDCEQSNRIEELSRGATVDGKLLCDEHLPKGHRWAF